MVGYLQVDQSTGTRLLKNRTPLQSNILHLQGIADAARCLACDLGRVKFANAFPTRFHRCFVFLQDDEATSEPPPGLSHALCRATAAAGPRDQQSPQNRSATGNGRPHDVRRRRGSHGWWKTRGGRRNKYRRYTRRMCSESDREACLIVTARNNSRSSLTRLSCQRRSPFPNVPTSPFRSTG